MQTDLYINARIPGAKQGVKLGEFLEHGSEKNAPNPPLQCTTWTFGEFQRFKGNVNFQTCKCAFCSLQHIKTVFMWDVGVLNYSFTLPRLFQITDEKEQVEK